MVVDMAGTKILQLCLRPALKPGNASKIRKKEYFSGKYVKFGHSVHFS